MSALFDVRTLFLIGGLTSVICAITLASSTRAHRPTAAAVAWSAAAQGFLAAAMLGIAMRGLIPDVLSYVVANALGAGAFALLYEASRRVAGVPPRPTLAATAVAAAFALQVGVGASTDVQQARLIVTAGMQGGYAAAMIPLLARRLDHDPRLPMLGALGLATVFAAANAARVASALLFGVETTLNGSYVVGIGQSLVFALFALAPMLHAMLILSLANGRIARDLRALAEHDELTGLLNRRSFFERAAERLHALKPDAGEFTELMMMDLDHFKRVNDEHGHHAGDRVLSHFAGLARRVLGPDCELGRYGGEEFCALLVRSTPQAVRDSADALCAALRAHPVVVDGTPIALTVSIGLTQTARTASPSIADLLRAADRRVYLAKARGRDRVVCDDEPMPTNQRRVGEVDAPGRTEKLRDATRVTRSAQDSAPQHERASAADPARTHGAGAAHGVGATQTTGPTRGPGQAQDDAETVPVAAAAAGAERASGVALAP